MNLSPRRLAVVAASVVAVAAVLAACGDDSKDSASTQPATTAASLDGTTFVSQSATGLTLVDGTEVRLSFTATDLGVNVGCNSQSGTYTIDGNVLTVGPMISTMMACEPALMDQDTAIATFLAAKPTIALTGDQLVLTTSDATLTLVAEADLPLEGTTWVVTTLIEGDAASSVPGTGVATMTFADGQVTIDTGCNTGGGAATVTPTTITFGPLALTKKACDDDATKVENAVLVTLGGDVTYVIDGSELILTRDDVGLQLLGQS